MRDTIDEVARPDRPTHGRPGAGAQRLAWGAWAVSAGLVCRSLGVSLSPVELVFVTAVINLGVVIPSSPGFVGTYQWLAVAALGVVGVDGEVAIAFSLLMQADLVHPDDDRRRGDRDPRGTPRSNPVAGAAEPPVPSPG